MVDLVGAVMALLLADDAVAARVDGRAFGGELPASETPHMPRLAFVVKRAGGSAPDTGYVETVARRVDVFSYGATPAEADALSADIELVMLRLRRSAWAGVLLHSASISGGWSAERDQLTAWPRAFQSFQILHSLQGV